jgi:hypothetical protein
LKLPAGLPTIEEVLKTTAYVMEALTKPGLPKAEVLRFSRVLQAVKAYRSMFASFIRLKRVEVELFERAVRYELLAKEMRLKAPAARRAWSRLPRIATNVHSLSPALNAQSQKGLRSNKRSMHAIHDSRKEA